MKKTAIILSLIMIILTTFAVVSHAEELNYENLIENHGSIMLIIDSENGDIIYANKAAVGFYGYKKETLESMKISNLNTMTEEEAAEEMNRAKEQEENHFNFKHITSDGTIKNIEVSSYPIEADDNNLLFSVVNDVTEKVMIENRKNRNEYILISFLIILALVLSYLLYSKKKIVNKLHLKQKEIVNKEKLRKTYIDADPVYTSLKDENFRYVFANKALCQFIGDTEDNIAGKTDFEVLKDEAEKIRKIDETVLENMDTVELIEEIRGQIYKVIKFPVELLNGEYGVGGYFNNITEKEEINRKLKENRNRLRSILETTQDGFWIVGENKKIIDVNHAYCKMSGYSREEILNLTISDLEYYESPEETKERIEKIIKTGHDLFETKHIKKDGEIFDVEVSISLFSKEPLEITCFFRDITQRKEDNQKIIEMNERLQNIIEGTNAGTWVWNLKTGETIFDDKWAEMLGYTLEEISPVNIETWKKLTHPDDLKKAGKELEKVMNKELDYYDFELRMKHKNGEWIWIHDRGRVTKWSDESKALFMSGTHMDISDRKKIEEKLKENQVRLELAMDAGEHGFWDWDLSTNSTYFSPTFYTMLGYEDKEIPMNFDIFKNLIHPDDAKKVISKIEQTIEDGTPYEVEFRLKCKDGSYKWILDKGKAYFNDESEKPYRAVGVHIDINEKKEAEEKLRESEIRFNVAVEGTEAGIWDWDMVNNKVTFSSQWKNMLGYSDNEIENSFEDWKKLWHPDDVEGIEKSIQDHLQGVTEKYEVVHRLRHKNGEWRWIMTRGKLLKDQEGKPYRWVGTNIDISSQKEVEEQVFNEKEKFKTTLLSVGDAVISTDKEGKINVMNKVAEKLTGSLQ
ncbi:MAG: PAS domain S-box protein [Bacillota bacterium]|nr:PAS domain S-box protein [Bacillota bacterium]